MRIQLVAESERRKVRAALLQGLPADLSEYLDADWSGTAFEEQLPVLYDGAKVGTEPVDGPESNERRLWHLAGLDFWWRGRHHEALRIFWTMYLHILRAQERDGLLDSLEPNECRAEREVRPGLLLADGDGSIGQSKRAPKVSVKNGMLSEQHDPLEVGEVLDIQIRRRRRQKEVID